MAHPTYARVAHDSAAASYHHARICGTRAAGWPEVQQAFGNFELYELEVIFLFQEAGGTFTGSMTPAATRSSNLSVAAL